MIDRKLYVDLNGFKQKIHIKGDPNKNIILFLHGGPGAANRHMCCKLNQDLLDDFMVVGWDQRGTGGSYWGCDVNTLTIDQLVEDTQALVKYLCDTYKKEKIFTVGGSWGSLLGIRHAYKHPENLYAFLGFGQFVDGELNEKLSYEFAYEEAKKANDVESLKTLDEIGAPVMAMYKNGYTDLKRQREVMNKYGGYSKKNQPKSYTGGLAKAYLTSGEYSPLDITGVLLGSTMIMNKMWEEIGKVKLENDNTKFECPILIFDGRLDKNTPADLVEGYYKKIKAPYKELIWFDEAGHNPLIDCAEDFKDLLKDRFHKAERGELCKKRKTK